MSERTELSAGQPHGHFGARDTWALGGGLAFAALALLAIWASKAMGGFGSVAGEVLALLALAAGLIAAYLIGCLTAKNRDAVALAGLALFALWVSSELGFTTGLGFGIALFGLASAVTAGLIAVGLLKVASPQDYYGGLALAFSALFAFWASSGLPGMKGFAFGPGTAPRLFAGLLLATGAGVVVTSLLAEGPPLQRYSVRGLVFIIASLVFFGATIRTLGLVFTSFFTIMISVGAAPATIAFPQSVAKEIIVRRLIDVLNVGLGALLFLSPWILGLASAGPAAAAWNAWILGVAIAGVTVAALALPTFAEWKERINLILGLWLLVSPLLLGFSTQPLPTGLHVLVGIAVIEIAVFELMFKHRRALGLSDTQMVWVELALGVWVLISPWVLGFAAHAVAVWAHVIAGAALAEIAVIELISRYRGLSEAQMAWIESIVWAEVLTLFCSLLFPNALNLPLQLWPRY
jgi:putative tricarboxylic transport membrane protein